MLHNPPNELYWCTSHARLATATDNRGPCCEHGLGGILLPCHCVRYELDTEDLAARQATDKPFGKFMSDLILGESFEHPETLPIIYRRK